MYVVFSANQVSAENMEEVDEDIAVTQSQVNFTCPLTQVLQLYPLLILLSNQNCSTSKAWSLCLITHFKCIQGGNGEPREE